MKKIISLFVLLVLVSSVYAITEQEKKSLFANLDKYKDDPVKLRLILSMLNSNIDISDDLALVNQVRTIAALQKIDMDKEYPNIKAGIPEDQIARPVAPTQEQPNIEPVIEQAAEQTLLVEQKQEIADTSLNNELIVSAVIAAAVIIGLIIFLQFKKKNKR